MAVFDESKVISALHPEKAEIGKKYWRSDNLLKLKKQVEEDDTNFIGELFRVAECPYEYPFQMEDGCDWQFLYPYEEPPKKLMTNRQLTKWLAKGNGECKCLSSESIGISASYAYIGKPNDECVSSYRIRYWDSDEWIEPTVDVYEHDCKVSCS